MIRKHRSVVLILILMSLIFIGCWDSRDIQEKNIATAVITDYRDGKYSFLAEIANIMASKKSSGVGNSSNKFSTIRSEGNSLPDSRYDLDRKSDSPLYLGAARVLVLTGGLAEHGIEEYINRVRGTADYRKAIDVVTTSSPPESILKDKPENDISAGFAIEDTLRSLNSNGLGIHVTVGNLLEAFAVKKAGFLLSNIIIEGGEITINGYSVFKDGKKLGYIPSEESHGLINLLNRKAKFIYDVEYKGIKLTIETCVKKLKIKSYYNQEKPKFNISLAIAGKILYMNKITPIDKELMEKFSVALKGMIYNEFTETLMTAQKEFACDYLEFYKYFRISYPKVFKTINWNEAFSKAEIHLDLKADISNTGLYDINPQISK